MKLAALTLFLLLASSQIASAAPIARLILFSEPGDYIGLGGTYDITRDTADGDTVVAQILRTVGSGDPALLDFFLFDPASPGDFAFLTFGTDQLGIPIQPGSYSDAQRAVFAQPGFAGLDVGFQGRGSNTLTGSFTIHTITFLGSPLEVDLFQASFEQHSEGAAPALFGTFVYSQSGVLPSAVPEPASLSLLGIGLAGIGVRRWRQSRGA